MGLDPASSWSRHLHAAATLSVMPPDTMASRIRGANKRTHKVEYVGGDVLQPQVERELIRKSKAGDTRFYEHLVRAYEPAGLRLAVAMMGNVEDARDALQEAFVKAFDSLHRVDLRRPFGPWLFQILMIQCRDMLRSRQARFRVEVLDEKVELKPADPERRPERLRERSAARELLWRALEQIGVEDREVLVLKELGGFRYGEIAEILAIPEGTVDSRLSHARGALKDALLAMTSEYP